MSVFVGRERELAILHQQHATAVAEQGGVALITGEPGIGKTRLAREFAGQVSARGTQVLWGSCREDEWSAPLQPWIEAITTFVRTASPDRVRDALNLESPQSTSSLAHLVPNLESSAGELPGLVPLPPVEERQRLFDAVARFLLRLSQQQPLLIVVDDIHWADRPSLDLFRHLTTVATRARILLLGLYRDVELSGDHPLTALLVLLRREVGASPIALRGLSADEIVLLLSTATSHGQHATLGQTLASETNGNPFFIEEILGHLVEEITHVTGQVTTPAPATGLPSLAIPDGVRQMVLRRLARLSPPTEHLLTHAAVFAGGFDFAVLPALTALPEATLLDAIDEALSARLIQPVPGGEERYDFVHAIVRHALTESWSPSRRVRLHRRAAEALERTYAGRLADHAAELAVQYHRSRTLPGAETGLPYALAAANAAERASATDQVVTFLRMARDLTGSDPATRADILCRLAVAEAEAVFIAAAQQTTSDASEALAAAKAPPAQVAMFLESVARALKHRAYAESRVWRPLVEHALSLLADHRDRIWARLVFLNDPVAPVSRSVIRAGRWTGYDPAAIAIARSTGDDEDYARSFESWDPRTREETDRLVTLARGWHRPAAIMYALTVASNDYQYRHGAFRDAEALWRELNELSERYGAISWQQQATSQLAALDIAFGRFDSARDLQAQAASLGARLGPGLQSALYDTALATGFAVYLGGDWPALAAHWRNWIDDPALEPTEPTTLSTAYFAAIAAYGYAETGDNDAARRLLVPLNSILEAMDPRQASQNDNGAVAFAGSAIWLMEDNELALPYHRFALRLLDAGIGDDPLGSTELTVARMSALLGRFQDALSACQRARLSIEQSGREPLRAIVDMDEAAILLRSGSPDLSRARQLLADAMATFAALRMTPWLRRTEALSARLQPRGGEAALPAGITERELDVLRLIAKGCSDREISDLLFISPRTVHAHVRNMLNKTGALNRTGLSVWAMTHGLIPQDDARPNR